MDEILLSRLRCPVNGMPVRMAAPDEVQRLAPDWAAALIREDGARIYPVEEGIPLLVPAAGRDLPA